MSESFERSILAIIAEDGPITPPEIAAQLNAHPSRIERQCRILQQNEELHRVTGGQFVVTPNQAERTASD